MNLTRIPTSELERFRAALVARRIEFPLSRLMLRGDSLESLASAVADLNAAGPQAVLAVVEAVLAERKRQPRRPELVWTGPESKASGARDTAAVLAQLFQQAERTILLAGFAFDHADEVLRPLHSALEKGVSCRLFADANVASGFLKEHWPFGPPFPDMYGFKPGPGVLASLHAKCVVVDERRVFVTSANFTNRGQTRNVEVGVLLDDPDLARVLESQFVGGAWFARA